MSTMGVNSQRPVQSFQTQNTGFVQPQAQQQAPAQQDPLAALSKALEALEQAVQSLTTKGFNNNQSVASQASQNLGTSGNAQGNNNFDWANLLGGGSTFDKQPQATALPPVQQNTQTTAPNQDFLGGSGGGALPTAVPTHTDHGVHLGNEKSGGGGGIRVGSDGANNAW